MQTSGSINKHQLSALFFCHFNNLKTNACRISATLFGYYLNTRTLSPYLQLLNCSRTEGVSTANQSLYAISMCTTSNLTNSGSFTSTVNAYKQNNRGRIRKRISFCNRKLCRKALHKGAAKLIGAHKVFSRRTLTQVIGDTHCHLSTHVSHNQRILKVIPKVFGDLSTHIKDLANSLTGTLKTTAKIVHKAH